MLAADDIAMPIEFPSDSALDRAMLHLAPTDVLELCRERMTGASPAERAAWQSCQVLEALYHPGRYVRLAYALLGDVACRPDRYWPEGQIVYLHAPARTPISRRGVMLEVQGCRFEAYLFPEDRRLRGLRRFTGRDQAAGVWQSWLDLSDDAFRIDPDSLRRALIRYVPGQKWVARLRARGEGRGQTGKRSVAVRVGRPAVTARIQTRHEQLGAASWRNAGRFDVPRTVGSAPGLVALQWLKGASLLDTLRSADPREVLGSVATAVAGFHQSTLTDLPALTPRRCFLSAAHAIHDLKLAYPKLGLRLDALLRPLRRRMIALERSGPAATVTLHNDLHWNQLRFLANRVTILDLERMGAGDPLIDVANLATQLRMLLHRPEMGVDRAESSEWADSFLEAWRRTSGQHLDAGRFDSYAVISLLELARGMMRHLRPGWQALAARCLDTAEEVLG